MIPVEYIGVPVEKADLDGIFALLCACDEEFTPPLSARVSSHQQALHGGVREEKPYSYFAGMKGQHFLVARAGGRMIAFLTFLPDYTCDVLMKYGVSTYMTTACVEPAYRGQGLVNRMYDFVETELPQGLRRPYVTARTWSGNQAQMHSFAKRGYEIAACLPNDRGPGVDTIYFAKRVYQEDAHE